jgi:hypothetical protein
MMRINASALLVLALASALAPSAAWSDAGPAAEVTLLTGRGTAADPSGNIRALAKGQPVHEGEVISTGANSFLNLRFRDGSYVLIRPTSRFQIEQYRFDPPAAPAAGVESPDAKADSAGETSAPATTASAPAAAPAGSRAFFKLLRGGFRAVSGLIGKANSGDYRVATPVATIGIRGTDYETFLCDRVCQADPVIREALGRITAGLPAPRLLRARLGAQRGRLIKADGGGDFVQVTYTHDWEVDVTDASGKSTPVPSGTGAVTTNTGSTSIGSKPGAMGDTPDPETCN